MRISLAAGVFSLAVLAAACGGGGGGAPAIPHNPAPVATALGKTAASVKINIPAASAQSRSRKPFIISASTLSVVITVVPLGTTATAADWQVFPVTTPTPCQPASGGGESCTFNVIVPFGNDTITVSTYAVANPTAADVALASVSGSIVISRTSTGTPPPLNLTLNADVAKVVVAVPSPEPSNSPNTQVFTVGVAQTSAPLVVTAYDATGVQILANGVVSPNQTISVSPGSAGVALAIAGTCAGSSGGGSSVSIGCFADLSNVTLSYNGTITPDASDHITDTFAISASQAVSPAPSPAHVVLQGNLVTVHPNQGTNAYSGIYLQSLPSSNAIAYLMGNGSGGVSTYGTLSATGVPSAQTTLSVLQPTWFYAMTDGSIWLTDASTDTLQCFNSTGGNPQTTVTLAGSEYPSSVIFDGTKLWWGTYTYSPGQQNYAHSAAVTSTCTLGTATTYTLPTTYVDGTQYFTPLLGGGMAIDGGDNGDFWTISASGVVSSLNPGFSPGSGFGGGAATDGAGKTYATFTNGATSLIDTLAGSTLTQLTTAQQFDHFGSLSAFGPNNGAADRLAFAATSTGTFSLIDGPNGATPLLLPVALGWASFNSGPVTAFSAQGAPVAAYYDDTTSSPAIGIPLLTTTWFVPTITLPQSDVFSIDERGDSGPFTVTVVGAQPTCLSSISPVSGTDHAFNLYTNYTNGQPCPVTVKITDRNGRTQTVSVFAPENGG